MSNNISNTPTKILTIRSAMVQRLSISLNELSALGDKVINHDTQKECLESKLLKLVNTINLYNHNAKRGRANV